ncbi:MAG: carbon-nitrogen hydrolase family protein [Alphaproteobacteria bacterium]
MTDDINWKVGVVQMDCSLGDVAANLERIGNFAEAGAKLGVELLIYPETVTTGYFISAMLDKLAEPADGPSAKAIGKIAAANALHLAAGMVTREGNRFFDSQLLFSPEGQLLAEYRKVHLFAAEREWYSPGDRPVVVETRLGMIGLSVCYDLIFPDYIRRLTEIGADIVINSTNWISDGYQREVWGWGGPGVAGLAATRALENVTFVAMADRVGHEQGFTSLGHSCVAGPSGKLFASLQDGEGMAVADIAIPGEDLDRWRGIATYREDRRPEVYAD